ncbi:hypothetical protein [Microbacterium gorillae]|uniref:hypothetical protein n=1 Tax=Microbacterium gorillae TaxID=1231063 RepID=UPI00058B609F|nr:hypothetical protein [Microbacterium gorillae]
MTIDWNAAAQAVTTLAQRQHDQARLDASLAQERAARSGEHGSRLSQAQEEQHARLQRASGFRRAVQDLAAPYDVEPSPWTQDRLPAATDLEGKLRQLRDERPHLDALNGADQVLEAARQAALPGRILGFVWLGVTVVGTAAILAIPYLLAGS